MTRIAACMIPLHDRKGALIAHAIVSPEDSHLADHRWSYSGGYAIRRKNGRLVKLHREVLGLATGDPRYGDHIDGNCLDCRRENLRVITRTTSQQNVSSHRGSTSSARGVSFCNRTRRWIAQATVSNVNHWLGRHATENEAVAAVVAFRAQHMPFATEGTVTR